MKQSLSFLYSCASKLEAKLCLAVDDWGFGPDKARIEGPGFQTGDLVEHAGRKGIWLNTAFWTDPTLSYIHEIGKKPGINTFTFWETKKIKLLKRKDQIKPEDLIEKKFLGLQDIRNAQKPR
jgi:hypothetical protein